MITELKMQISYLNFTVTPGVASKLALSVPGSAGTAGLKPSMDSETMELDLEVPNFFFLCRAFWMDAMSHGRLANWWKTLLFRMMAYTTLQLPEGKDLGVDRGRNNTGVQLGHLSSHAGSHHRTDTG